MNLTKIQNTIRFLSNRYKRFGGAQYTINEPTTILNHSLQSAFYARHVMNGTPEQIVFSLLHDYGHIANGAPIFPDTGIDDQHEIIGSQALKELGFPDSITIPISLHVSAKRYLTSIEPNYKLSKGSLLSLQLQGGKMNTSEIVGFEKNPYYTQALFLRIVDDRCKSQQLFGNDILVFQGYMERILR